MYVHIPQESYAYVRAHTTGVICICTCTYHRSHRTDVWDFSVHMAACRIDSEDDLLHMWDLPDMSEDQLSAALKEASSARALGQHDSELLLSYLTVPYLRIPLVVSFFASEDRVHLLQSPKLQARTHIEP